MGRLVWRKLMNSGDTIFALASGQGRAAIAVIRLSGPQSGTAVRALCAGSLPPPRRASLRRLSDPRTGEALDQALVLWFPAPGSFTGEDQAELHIHGGTAVRAAIVRVLADQPRCRPAEPGEFTRRAFLNGRLDLTEVEGLADLIEAETEAQRRQALRQMEGELSTAASCWRDRLSEALALCEAGLDFTDADDVPADVAGPAQALLAAVRDEIARSLAGAARGERLREGFTVVIAGPPNAGKSTLLNAIARRDVAIVSPVPGTTRDAIEVRADIRGLPVTFVDTAGLRESEDVIEREGVARAEARIAAADLVLWLTPAQADPEVAAPTLPGGRHAEERTGRRSRTGRVSKHARASRVLRDALHCSAPRDDAVGSGRPLTPLAPVGRAEIPGPGPMGAAVLPVTTKSDLAPPNSREGGLAVSALTGAGLDRLLEDVHERASAALTGEGDAVVTRERHRTALEEASRSLDRAASLGANGPLELVAEDLRLALRALGRLTGTVDVEDILDRIFSSFCIGK